MFLFIGVVIKLLLLATNIINTSHLYDQTIEAPFRVEQVSVNANLSKIDVEVKYYVNTNRKTLVSLSVNDIKNQDLLSPTRAKRSLRKINLNLPNVSENTTLDLNFSSIWNQNFSLNGKLFFDNQTIANYVLKEDGDYRYKIIRGINFNNEKAKFFYNYDYIDFTIIQKPVAKFYDSKPLFKINSKIKKYHQKLYYQDKLIWSGDQNEKVPFDVLFQPGIYNLEIKFFYWNGAINKKIKFDYEYKIEKYYIGNCKNSYYCVVEGNQIGILEEVKKHNMIL